MILQAQLTDSHTTEIRNSEEIIIDSLLERKIKSEKEPRIESYAMVFTSSYSVEDFTFPFKQNSDGFLTLYVLDNDYPPPNFNFLSFSYSSLNAEQLNYDRIVKTNLIFDINWMRTTVNTNFGSDFSFDLYLNIYEMLDDTVTNFDPFLQLNIGTINFDTALNKMTMLNKTIQLNLSKDITQEQIFINGVEEDKITIEQLYRLQNGKLTFSAAIGFDVDNLSAPIKNWLYNNNSFKTRAKITFAYYGKTKF